VHYGIGTRTHIGRTLSKVRQYVKYFLGRFIHFESTMCCIAMLKKCLAKQRKIPNGYKENKYKHNLPIPNVKTIDAEKAE